MPEIHSGIRNCKQAMPGKRFHIQSIIVNKAGNPLHDLSWLKSVYLNHYMKKLKINELIESIRIVFYSNCYILFSRSAPT